MLLVVPLLLFVGVTFLAPLGMMLLRSVHDPVVADALPETLGVLAEWDGEGLPPEAAYETIARELTRAREERTLGQVAGRVNRVESGMRSLFTRTARGLLEVTERPWREVMVELDEAWGQPAVWNAVRATGQRFTARHYLNAVDMQRLPDGSVARQPEERRIYLSLMWRTLWVSGAITVLCLLLGYPIAHLIAHSPPRRTNLLLLLVLVPFWTSLLVRTTAWIVLLQTQGVLNDILVAIGLIGDDGRLTMIYNMTGTIVAMTHVLLPLCSPRKRPPTATISILSVPAVSRATARLLRPDSAFEAFALWTAAKCESLSGLRSRMKIIGTAALSAKHPSGGRFGRERD